MKFYRYILALGMLVALTFSGLVMSTTSATSTANSGCVPSAAWSETLSHTAVTHEVTHPETSHTVHHAAVTHKEYSYQKQVLGWNGSWSDFNPGQSGFFYDWSTLERTSIYYNGHNYYIDEPFTISGNKYRWHEYSKDVVDKAAWDEKVIDKPAWTETVVDKAAWDEVIDHPSVDCPTTEVVTPPTQAITITTMETPGPKYFIPHIKVIDKCRCKSDNVIVKHDKRIQFSSVKQVSKTKWKVKLVAEPGYFIPKNIKKSGSKWVTHAVYKFKTTNKPCACEGGTCGKTLPPPPICVVCTSRQAE